MSEFISVGKEVYDAVLRNSVRVSDLEAENQQLKELLKDWVQFETEENPNDFTVISERMSELTNKTNQVLGE